MAPELVRKHEYDGKHVDMWALGVMLYAMLSGAFPFRGQSEHELYLKIQRGNYRLSDSVSKEARVLIAKLLETDSRKRLKAIDLL
jgi:serine/threonine protein kinase